MSSVCDPGVCAAAATAVEGDFECEEMLAGGTGANGDVGGNPAKEMDITMVTLLQPTEMLKGELHLHEAARKNDTETLKLLLSRKVAINAKNNLDRTALHWAAANGHVACMELLLKAGCELEAQDKYGMSAILWAAWFGHKEGVRLMVNAGANIHSKNRQGMNMLHCAAVNNHITVLQFIHDSLESFSVNKLDQNERSGLHLAAEKGHVETVEKLLSMKVEVNKKDKEGRTALHVATLGGYIDVLIKILKFGVEVDDRDNEGQTALHLAASAGQTEAAEVLLNNHADPNAETTKENSPLHVAGIHGNCDVIKLLIEHQCQLNAQNTHGNTAVHLAALNNQPDSVRLLVDSYAELDLPNKRSQTALHAAVESGFSDVVEVLLVAGADLEAREKTGKSALGLASRGSYIGIVDMIIKADRFYSAEPRDQVSSRRSVLSDASFQFKRSEHAGSEGMKEVLWKLATKQLKPNEWKKLAIQWGFTENHVKAIEHQFTGPNSYRDHGYRLLLIWLHGVKKEESPMKHLYEGLVAIGRRELADQIRRKAILAVGSSGANNSNGGCVVS